MELTDNEKAVVKTANAAVTAAQEATADAKAVTERAGVAVTKIDKIETALGGAEWEKNLHDVVQLARDHKDGKTSTSKEQIVALIKGVNDQMHADMRARGVMVGGQSVSERGSKVFDSWTKEFDHASFLFQTRAFDPTKMSQKDVFTMAMQSAPRNELQKGYQHATMDLMIADAIGKNAQRGNYRGFRETFPKLTAVYDYFRLALWSEITQKAALDPNDVADTGLWVPTVFAPDFRELLWLELRVEALFDFVTYSGPGNVWRMPLDLTDYVGDLVPDTLSMTYALANPFSANDPIQLGKQLNDGKKDFTFQKHRGRVIFTGELDEDSVISILGRARAQVLRAIAKASETAIINGQKSGAIDTAPGTYDAQNSWDGLRKAISAQGSSAVAGANGALTVTQLMQSVPALMGKYGVNPADGAIILPPVCLYQIITDSSVWTAEKYGPQATIFQGSLAAVGGKPIVVSEFVSTGLNASGVVDGITTDRTEAIVVNRRQFLGVEKRSIDIGADYYRASDVTDVVGMRRLDFGKLMGNSEKVVAAVVNVRST
jgi:hypothetical protein